MTSNRDQRPARTAVNRNPLQLGILNFLTVRNHEIPELNQTPKKYTLYVPLLLLPVNFTSAPPAWSTIYKSLSQTEKADLFASITTAFRQQGVTHIAINAPISPDTATDGTSNSMRSPLHLNPIYGDFGPTQVLDPRGKPYLEDFDAAFWVSVMQNGGIVQRWAPLWTMFSRGNITEKARILGEEKVPFPGLDEEELGEELTGVDVVDFYVGIGYFAFSYLKRGVRRVFGWEINGWSVEGLRRGCESNGWGCLVVKVDEQGWVEEGDIQVLVKCVAQEGDLENIVRCVVFWGDNRWAAKIMEDIKRKCGQGGLSRLNVRHANLGLLPSARPSWHRALQVLDHRKECWLHVHENVDIEDVESVKVEMVKGFRVLVKSRPPGLWRASCSHVEYVKTYAPGVMHCVFDIRILPGF